ncbi:aldo/keto reductase [Variovorax sp. HJSM1_2]|uniref:aldo/keto reductase n=1 Tax=Variovorax sp. HJSM1_2 TaxID=3366263 RepID=UPI003BDBEFE1
MKKSTLGASGLLCSRVGLGTWAMGGWMWGGTDDTAAIAAIHAAFDAGSNFIDTAPAYGLGHAEEVVGQALQGRRHEAVVSTKCGLVWHTQKGTHFFDEEGQQVYRYLGRDAIAFEVEQSLRRLRTDYIDLYFTHWQDATTPVAETMGALLDLKAQGKIRAIGISNADAATLGEYLRHGPVDAVQERYSLLDRGIESELMPLCRAHGVAIHGYGSLAMGALAGPQEARRVFTGDDQRRDNPRFAATGQARLAAFFQDITPLKDAHGCSFGQLMVAWALSKVDVALCGARQPAQAMENAGAGDIKLNPTELQQIAAAAKQRLENL